MAKPLRVLIVEDSEDDALLVIHELKRGGNDVTFKRVETAEAMTAALDKQAWDVIISDYRLPHFSAPESLELLHQSSLDLPFIVISGTIGEETAVEMMKAGAHDYLMKGNLKRLVPVIERELNEAAVRQQRRQVQYDLNERVKELQCLYSIAMITERPGVTLDEVYQEIVRVLPQGWQYPEITCAKITIGGKEFKTKNYKGRYLKWTQSSDIKTFGSKVGKVDISYLEERPERDEGPFIKEERELINAVVERLGRVTERRQKDEELRNSEERLKILFEYAPDGVYLTDLKGNFVDGNIAAEKLIGYERQELIGKGFLQLKLLDPKQMLKAAAALAKSILGQPTGPDEFILHRKDGKQIPVEISTFPVKIKDKTLVLGVARDITYRKKMEEQLMVTDRLASVGELASGVAHELNNPLTSVIGFSDLLLGRDLPDDIKEDLKIINREAQRTAGIVKNLLTFARKHETEKKLVNINELIQKVLELRAYEQKVNNIQTNTQFSPDLPKTMADAFQLQQMFINIIINAEHFMDEAHRKGTLTITTKRAGDIIQASFADDGPGIPKENLGHLFDPFFTTKEVGKGTGLGLSICHGIITEHGGSIYAKSELGKGATFVVELPVTNSDKGGANK